MLEVNLRHPLVERLEQEQDEALFGDLAWILFDQAALAEGGQLDDPAGFVRRLNKLVLNQPAGGGSKKRSRKKSATRSPAGKKKEEAQPDQDSGSAGQQED